MFTEFYLKERRKKTLSPDGYLNICDANDLCRYISVPFCITMCYNGIDGVRIY